MGWYYTHKPDNMTVRQFFEKECSSIEIIESALVKLHTFYAACRRKSDPTGPVWCMVCLVNYAPADEFNFGYKDMDESVGPVEDQCPQKVFSLLSPLGPRTGKNDWAHDWRDRVQANLDKKKARPVLSHGDRVKFEQPMSFVGLADRYDTFIVEKDVRTVRFRMLNGIRCSITGWKDRPFAILPA